MDFGIILSIIAALAFGVSIALQKYSMKSVGRFSFKRIARNRVWLAALAIGIIGILMYLAALNMADLSTVQPVTSLTLAVPVLAGVFFFKEKLGGFEWALLALVVLGIVLVSIS